MMQSMVSERWYSLGYVIVIVGLVVFGLRETWTQHTDNQYVAAIAAEVTRTAQANTTESQVIALRDYVRAHVGPEGYSAESRPFLRKSTAETLRSGQGFCGGAARAFINLAAAVGIKAQRLYLEGSNAHVVAQVWFPDGRTLVVDPYREFYFADNVPLAAVLERPEFSAYYTLGWRRLGALHLLPSHGISLGALSYFLENPPALVSVMALAVALALFLGTRRLMVTRTVVNAESTPRSDAVLVED